MNERTPFQNHLNITNVTPTQAADEITCQIGGTLRATVKNINLAPSDMIKLLIQLPANCHIISVEVSQFHHAESSEGEMYNSVKIDYQTDELMTKTLTLVSISAAWMIIHLVLDQILSCANTIRVSLILLKMLLCSRPHCMVTRSHL